MSNYRPTILVLCLLLAGAAHAQENPRIRKLELAVSLINRNELLAAEEQLNSVLRTAPKEVIALNLLGTIKAKQGKLNDAEALFLRAVAFDKDFGGARMNLAHLYLLKGDLAKTADQLKEVVRLDPNNPEARYRLAWVLLSQRRFDECINFIEQIRNTESLPNSFLTLLGEAYLKRGDTAKAEELYLQMLNEQQGNAEALLGLLSVAMVKKDVGAADQYFNRAKEVVGESPELLYKFALAAMGMGLRDEAVSSLKRAINLKPGEATYHYVLGTSWLKATPDLLEAEQAFRDALRLQPGNAQSQLHLGYVLLKQKRYPEAREWFESTIKSQPNLVESYYYLGVIAQEQNENERAVLLLEKVLKIDPKFAIARIALGATYLKLKNYSRALQELEAGAKLSPEDSRVHYNLAILYTRLKNPERAKVEMEIVENLKSSGRAQQSDAEAAPSPRPR